MTTTPKTILLILVAAGCSPALIASSNDGGDTNGGTNGGTTNGGGTNGGTTNGGGTNGGTTNGGGTNGGTTNGGTTGSTTGGGTTGGTTGGGDPDGGTGQDAAVLPIDGAPYVLYTDILSGPNSGGEDGQGIYLSIFGKNFGSTGLGSTVTVTIGGENVHQHLSLGVSRGRPDIGQITVQVGALGNPTPGTPLPIVVTVNGVASNADHTFTVNPGHIYFADNVHGSESAGANGDFDHPYRYVQTTSLSSGGAWPHVQPGDFIVMRAGTWTDVGFEHYFMRYRDKSGSAPTGQSGTGPIAVMGYPGEDVFIRGTLANGMSGGCISAINGQSYPTAGKWAVITNLRIDCEGYDGPISQEIYGDHWRVVNNDLSASTAPTSGPDVPRMAGITGNGEDSVWLGNHIHDIQGSDQECHGIYIDGDGSYEIAYNHIENIRSGNGFQAYTNGGNGSDESNHIHLHHNLIHDVSKHGINLADGTSSDVIIFDNVVYNVAFAGVRFNTNSLSGAKIFNNTFYNTNIKSNSAYGILTNDWNLPNGSLDIENNLFWPASGKAYNGGSVGVDTAVGTISHNLWHGGSGSTSIDASPVSGDPTFVQAGTDFHLMAGSPAIDSGAAAPLSVVTTDYDATTTRAQGSACDVGAFEWVQ